MLSSCDKSLQELTEPLSPFYRWQDCSEEHHFRHLSLNWYLLSQQAEYFQTINTTRLSYRLIKYTQITSKFTWGAWIGFQKTADIAASQIFSLSRASNYHLLWWLHFLHLFHTHFFSLTRNSTFNKNFFKADEDLSGTEIIPNYTILISYKHYNIKLYFSLSTSIEKLLNFKQLLPKLGGKQRVMTFIWTRLIFSADITGRG